MKQEFLIIGFREADLSVLKQDLSHQESPTILDVRTPEEYNQGHVPGAQNLELSKLSAKNLEDLGVQSNEKVYVICQSGRRSAQACVRMGKVFGYTDCVNVKGGTQAWIDSGEEVER